MRGIEAIEYFLESWESKLNHLDEIDEFEAMVEYAFGDSKKFINTKVCIERFFDKRIYFEGIEELKCAFYPEEVEFDSMSGNLFIRKNLYKIKIAPRVF